MHENETGTLIVDSAVHLHQDPGPGLLGRVCEVTLSAELRKRGLSVERQIAVAIEYEGQRFDEGSRADLIVAGKVIVEPESVEKGSSRSQEAGADVSLPHGIETWVLAESR